MKNSLSDLNEKLLAEMDRLTDPKLEGEKLNEEIKRADVVAKIGAVVVNNANTVLRTVDLMLEYGVSGQVPDPLLMLENKDGGKTS